MRYEKLTEYREFNKHNIEKLLWPKSDTDAYHAISKDWDEQEKKWLKHVKNKNVVIQAGGNCGMYPLLYANHFDKVYTFEPDPLNFFCLVNNCQSKNIIKFNCALGNGQLVSLGHYEDYNIGTIKTTTDNSGYIPSIRIDDLNLKKCDMIHLDIEGFEEKALSGCIKTIEKFSPVIVLEKGEINGKSNIIRRMGYELVYKTRDTVYVRQKV